NARRQAGDGKPVDWIVMRNRLAHIDARNTREMANLLERLSKRLHFRLQPGFSERMVYRELFYSGLTLMDLPEDLGDARANARYHRARREVHELVAALGVADIAAEAGAPLAVPVV
ncbi:MAG: division plane positioning ATPase MipZ, partial [Alphaproteobacteria bacterium]